MPGVGQIARTAYVTTSRAARSAAQRTGVYERLDRRHREDPRSIAGHLRTLFAIHDVEDLVALDQPWWTYDAIEAVERHLEALGGAARVFEYGSGASSVWLGRRATEVHSVEHHAGFAEVMRRVLAAADLADTVTLHEVGPDDGPEPRVPSGRRGEEGRDYARYVEAIDAVPGEFDLVVVDGRARVACLQAAARRLAPGGIVLFDDTQRPRYAAGIAASGMHVRRYRGWVPSLPYPRETSVLRISRA
ncbi:class I SAM-dependent methyltransferase [Cellulomonas sp. PS-H5]|uniref:class I SAM-dependent methyltransferase n=1 Tax=Cellulomonas sp. PS-H5 TaxID=2820400 RepID=UPI001C4ED872|nr:class I SAM-dependent methyltransferase [Cellulomonas sp. PS-H5]MBW0254598.1 class I SAM-dependent methyltransferase [Cellulomonas sp. PS-H5]